MFEARPEPDRIQLVRVNEQQIDLCFIDLTVIGVVSRHGILG